MKKTTALTALNTYWKTQEGNFLRICDMASPHLVNTRDMIERLCEVRCNCGTKCGHEDLPMRRPYVYDVIVAELKRRKVMMP